MPILAALPILVILVLMIGFRWGAARAGAAGYLTAFLVAVIFFGAGADVLAFAHAKAFLLSMDVLLIIWAAFLLYRVAEEAGAIKTIGRLLPSLTRDRGMQALLIGWVFASFLQGAGGFGVPVAVTAPLLAGLGFSPLAAVLIPSIGHGWAVTFGSLGSSFNALLSATGLDAPALAPASALYLGLACVLTGPMVAHAADGLEGRQAAPHPCAGVRCGNGGSAVCRRCGGRVVEPGRFRRWAGWISRQHMGGALGRNKPGDRKKRAKTTSSRTLGLHHPDLFHKRHFAYPACHRVAGKGCPSNPIP